MLRFLALFTFAATIALSSSSTTCKPTPINTYTTTDASVLTSIAYISQFQLDCNVKENLYAVMNDDEIFQLASVGDKKWQVSFDKEIKASTRGDHTFQIFNEEGLSKLRKKLSPAPLATVVLNHPGAYNGPWLNSEHLAAIFSILVGWMAVASKGKLLA